MELTLSQYEIKNSLGKLVDFCFTNNITRLTKKNLQKMEKHCASRGIAQLHMCTKWAYFTIQTWKCGKETDSNIAFS